MGKARGVAGKAFGLAGKAPGLAGNAPGLAGNAPGLAVKERGSVGKARGLAGKGRSFSGKERGRPRRLREAGALSGGEPSEVGRRDERGGEARGFQVVLTGAAARSAANDLPSGCQWRRVHSVLIT